MAEIEHYVHPEKKDHERFGEVKDLVLSLLPAGVQLQGKTEVVPISVGEAVASVSSFDLLSLVLRLLVGSGQQRNPGLFHCTHSSFLGPHWYQARTSAFPTAFEE